MELSELLNKTDYEWYEELFKELSPTILKSINVQEVIEKSVISAEKVYKMLQLENSETNLTAVIESYGVTVVHVDELISSPNIALYDDSEKKLVIFTSTVKRLHQLILKKGMGELIDEKQFKQLILSHELYHIIEMNEADIYTYSKILKRKRFGFLKKTEQLPVASEVGAYHFSKILNQLQFSPRVIEVLPILA
ncbi:hypothetical protein [Jeotgalibaca ciconiae]|uniref:Uncharacterized protein n=1 Tax=Jeotgalibaca ciconiae TaxID=2496265 RepID=A0A3Q9BJ70_9LACT|nr:hypothetical protein [Jeotgalibaca ciconiae]AZP03602.1 hypothetical protein EJN90_02345 [Jeotgalibaca ciconiae]